MPDEQDQNESAPSDPRPITGELLSEPDPPLVPSDDGVVVHNPAGWSLVQHGSWEVSIGPDGMISLPKHLAPDEVEDFLAAVAKAAQVGAETQSANRSATPAPGMPSTLVVQESGQPLPPGAVRLTPSAGVSMSEGAAPVRLDPSDPTATEKSATLPRPPATT